MRGSGHMMRLDCKRGSSRSGEWVENQSDEGDLDDL